VRYAVLRVAMLVTVGGVLALVGLRGWVLLFAAVLISAVLSFFVFARQREAAARNLEAAVARRQAQDARWRAAAQGAEAGDDDGAQGSDQAR
jgi:cell division protein FtsL